jgi:hypothetical protein
MLFEPLPYQIAICDHLKNSEPGLWQWFMSDDFSGEQTDASKLELLKSCYRMTRHSHASLYASADAVAARLGIDCPITFYQLQSASVEPNAALYFFDDELCVVLSGPIADLLDAKELTSVIAHEFSHHKLYTENNGEFFAAARLLSWCADQADCHDAYVETARRYQLHTELYADLGSALVCEGPLVPIASLVKVNTGLKDVTVADYLAQAEEILAQDKSGAKGHTHPETYIRAKALDDAPKDTSRYLVLVRGKLDVRRLDVLDQRELATLTLDIAQAIGCDQRFRDDTHQILLREYFPSFEWARATHDKPTDAELENLAARIEALSESTHIYLAYLVLDLATAGRDDALPLLGAALHYAERLGIFGVFEALARKDLKLKKGDIGNAQKMEADRLG